MKLGPGEMICPKCDGEPVFKKDGAMAVCGKCWGSGKLDFVENVVGKKKPFSFDDCMDQMAEHFCKEIDREILEHIYIGLSTSKRV